MCLPDQSRTRSADLCPSGGLVRNRYPCRRIFKNAGISGINPNFLGLSRRRWRAGVSDNNADVSTLYHPDGTPIPLVVKIPGGPPTGVVFNPFAITFPNAFKLSNGQPAAFIFDSENGFVTAWNGGLMPITEAVTKVDNSASGAVYKGLTLAVRKNAGPTLYAANFNSGKVDIFDSHFQPVNIAGSFVDPNPPPVPKGTFGWAPFDLASIEGNIYVTFAAQNQKKHDDLAGESRGFVDVFDTEGHFIKRLITGGELNSPWGLARVPEHEHFGKFDDEVSSSATSATAKSMPTMYTPERLSPRSYAVRTNRWNLTVCGRFSFSTANFTSPPALWTRRTGYSGSFTQPSKKILTTNQ